MEQVLQYEIPAWHPLAVHFPLVLVLVGAGAVGLWGVLGRPFWRRGALLLFALAMAGALFAYFTGDDLAEQMEGDPIVDELVPLHEDAALYGLIATGVVLAVLAGVSWWIERFRPLRRGAAEPLAARLGVMLLALAAAALIAWTAHIGAVMVWGRPVVGG